MKFNGTYTDAPMGEGKADIFDRPEIKMGWEELCQHSEKGDRERSLIEGKAELGVSEKRFLQVHQEMHAVAKYVHEEKLRIKKAKFFRRLNKVLDNKLVKPSIIIEYVNQYQRGEIK